MKGVRCLEANPNGLLVQAVGKHWQKAHLLISWRKEAIWMQATIMPADVESVQWLKWG